MTSSIDVLNPTTEERIGEIEDASDARIDSLIEAGERAASEWARLRVADRQQLVRAFADLAEAHSEEIAMLDVTDSGKPVVAARDDVRRGIEVLRYFSDIGTEIKGETLPESGSRLVYTTREPFGVVGRIIPFNHPAQFALSKIAAPLMAGNAVLLKPAEVASLSAVRIGELAGSVLPEGLLSVVTGYGRSAGNYLVQHPKVRRIAFTGSVPTGKAIMATAAQELKILSLELGGKNPMIVFPDVDIDAAVRAAVKGMNFRRCSGQSCGSNSRVLVHESIYPEFVQRMIAAMQAIVVGPPDDPQTEMGPVISREQYDKVMHYLARGKQEGALLGTGGSRPHEFDRGYFVAPTLFYDVTSDMGIARDEIFGPVVSVGRWSTVEQVYEIANSTVYGLTANIWTSSLRTAREASRRVRAGYVWVNGAGDRPIGAPFGGTRWSGYGKENSLTELLSYTEEKTVDVDVC